MNRLSKGIWIPIEIWEDKNLTWSEKILFCEIDSFTSQDMDCFFSNEYIAELLNCTETTANKVLSSLIKKGYVIKTKFDGRKRFVKTAFSYNKADLHNGAMQGCSNEQGRVALESNIINTSNKLSNKLSKDSVSTHTFKKPSVDEIRAYCQERGNNVDAERFFDFYESKGWMVGKNKMKDWKACVRNWERDNKRESSAKERTMTEKQRREQQTYDDLHVNDYWKSWRNQK